MFALLGLLQWLPRCFPVLPPFPTLSQNDNSKISVLPGPVVPLTPFRGFKCKLLWLVELLLRAPEWPALSLLLWGIIRCFFVPPPSSLLPSAYLPSVPQHAHTLILLPLTPEGLVFWTSPPQQPPLTMLPPFFPSGSGSRLGVAPGYFCNILFIAHCGLYPTMVAACLSGFIIFPKDCKSSKTEIILFYPKCPVQCLHNK